MTKKPVASARYMTRFRCLGGECEATCCGGWGIAIEESEHRRLTVLAGQNTELRELVDRAIQLTPEDPQYARLSCRESGECSLLDEAGLCRIHASFGHAALFAVCATYPRYANEVNGEVEVFGTLSCPEVARLALLSEDGFEITRCELDEAPRKLRNRFTTELPYFRPYELVRSSTLKLLSRTDYAWSEKLFALLWLSDKLRPVLHAGCTSVSEAQLQSTFAALSEAPVLAALSTSFRSLDLGGPLPLMILHAALRPTTTASAVQFGHFDGIVREAWIACGLASTPSGEGNEAELLSVWKRYGELRSALPASVEQRIETCVTRYAMNHELTTPYMLSESWFGHVYDLVVRVACLRFLLNARLAAFTGSASELDRAIVGVTFAFARAVEHGDLPSRLQETLARQGLDSIAHAVGFLGV